MARPVRYVRDKPGDFKPHSDGSLPFSAFAVSGQMRKPLVRVGFEVIAIAKSLVPPSDDPRNGHYTDGFSINEIQATYVGKRREPRAVAEVQNDYWTAPAMEFGSGDPSVGDSAGVPRGQGGYNKPKRPLGRAASKVGDHRE